LHSIDADWPRINWRGTENPSMLIDSTPGKLNYHLVLNIKFAFVVNPKNPRGFIFPSKMHFRVPIPFFLHIYA
jgi:hypothetical protein